MFQKPISFKRILVMGACAAFFACPVGAQEVSTESLLQQPASVEHSIQTMLQGSQAVRQKLRNVAATQEFYKARGYQPFWVKSSGPTDRADDLLEQVEESWTHGLNPYSYHYEDIQKLWEADSPQAQGDLELLLSDAYIRLGQDLSGIRVNPAEMNTSSRFWKQPLTAQTLLMKVQQSYDVEHLIESIQPQGKTYHKLREELEELVQSPPKNYEQALPIRIRGLLKPYERDAGVPALRFRLGLPEKTVERDVYDDELAAAVIQFQRDNSLKADGVVGRQTLEILNITREHKINQVIANLERLRWVDEDKPNKFVVVNIPSATLWAVDDGQVEFEMPVIVGRKKRPTNTFITEIRGVRFNPNWTVPPTIKKDDILPKLREDPEYLSHKGMELIGMSEEGAVTLDPLSMDWNEITEDDLRHLRFVQDAGANNPLGRVRVLMPNRYNIYLHDTNEKYYFEKAGRAVSSGCIRLKEPERMAEFIMENRATWEDGDMQAMFDKGKTRDIGIDTPIPVYLLYYTVWLDQSGELVYGNDLYDYDEILIKMLKNLDGIFIPVDNTEMSVANYAR